MADGNGACHRVDDIHDGNSVGSPAAPHLLLGARMASVKVSLPPGVTERQRRELGAFARYCAKRIEQQLGVDESWSVSIEIGPHIQFTSSVSVGSTEGRGLSADAVLAVWEAMCRLEQRLLELRSVSRAA